jgi:CheY-like chemotaxis protein
MGEDDPYYKNLPIVALTANAIAGIKDMYIANGLDDLLAKPIDTSTLNSILEKWIPKEKQKGIEE